jgi:ATP-dependent protease ClpP protease subunit
MPSTRFALREPSTGQTTLHARNVAQWAELRAGERERFCHRVAAAAKRPAEQVLEDVVRGLYLGAAEAVEYGLIDEVCRPDAAIHPLPGTGSPMGFRPLR